MGTRSMKLIDTSCFLPGLHGRYLSQNPVFRPRKMGAICSVSFEWRFLQRRFLHFIMASVFHYTAESSGSHIGSGNDTVITGFMTLKKKENTKHIE